VTPTEQMAASRIAMHSAIASKTQAPMPDSTHPSVLALALFKQVIDGQLRPLAQRHPVALVLGAAAAGALAVQARPWRLASSPLVAQLLLAALTGAVRR